VKKINSLYKSKSPAERINGVGGKITHSIGEIIIVLWVAFTVVIIGWVCLASMSSTRNIFTNKLLSSGLTFKGFEIVFKQYNIMRYFINSVLYTGVACAGLIVLCAPAAFVLSKFTFKGKKWFGLIFSTSLGLPSIMLLPPLFMIICKFNINNSVLTLLIVYIATGIAFTTVFLMGFFGTIPMSVFDSGLIDGCSHISAFWKLVIPLAQPGIITVTIFNFIGYWNEYIWALSLANNANTRTLAVGLQTITQGMGNTGNYTGLFAGVVVVFVPTFILYILLSDKIIAGITSGSVKG
jgi:N-acetylglucosamine transport system permease protein